jgi:hypothetical protein
MPRAVRKAPAHPGKDVQGFGHMGEYDHDYEPSADEQREIANTHHPACRSNRSARPSFSVYFGLRIFHHLALELYGSDSLFADDALKPLFAYCPEQRHTLAHNPFTQGSLFVLMTA